MPCSFFLHPQKVVTALDRTWHPEHFFCAQCGAFFGPEGTAGLEGLPVMLWDVSEGGGVTSPMVDSGWLCVSL